MSGSARYSRAISANVEEIDRRLRLLEQNLERIGARASTNARETAEGLGDAIASALAGWTGRFRQGASTLSGQSASLGKDTARLGSAALRRLSDETEHRPLFALAVAVGVGVLIGLVIRKWD
ncbi:MAG: hypothetical protein ABSA90_02655 [Xanthobacteraceae bacterium]|jgi:ElaB/YqjD/DUF883 family membrane-anchored ribosome-binding protein